MVIEESLNLFINNFISFKSRLKLTENTNTRVSLKNNESTNLDRSSSSANETCANATNDDDVEDLTSFIPPPMNEIKAEQSEQVCVIYFTFELFFHSFFLSLFLFIPKNSFRIQIK